MPGLCSKAKSHELCFPWVCSIALTAILWFRWSFCALQALGFRRADIVAVPPDDSQRADIVDPQLLPADGERLHLTAKGDTAGIVTRAAANADRCAP